LKEQIPLLLELQKIDARVLEVRAAIQSLPEKLKPAKQDLAKLEALLQQERDRVAETERWRREQEALIAADDEAVKKAKAKLQSSKSTKDFAAASREVDNKRRSKSEREEEVLKVIEALEKSRAEMEAHERDVSTLREHVTSEEARINARIQELEVEAETFAAGRAELAARIDPQVLKRYDRTMQSRGVAVAPVVDGICQGCHMSVPPQLNNILVRMDSIEICPRCQRILFRADLFESPPEQVTDS
jgi:uncharacterized protein